MAAVHFSEENLKNSLQVAGGIVGAVTGFVATLLLLELIDFGNRADPTMSGVLALLLFAPCGAVGGLLLGTALARRPRPLAGSVERSRGREIERDPPRRRGRPHRVCPELNRIS